MNGRWEDGNEIGKFTCIKSTGNSVVDYCLIREQDRKLVNKFLSITSQFILIILL